MNPVFRGGRPLINRMIPGKAQSPYHHNYHIQRGSERWTQFVSLYGLNRKWRLNTRQTVGCGIPSSLLALPVDLRGLRSKLS